IMSFGRNFAEALGKAMRSTETKVAGFWTGPAEERCGEGLLAAPRVPVDGRLYLAEQALAAGATVEDVAAASGFDPWFVDQIALVREIGDEVHDAPSITPELLRRAKRYGRSERERAARR